MASNTILKSIGMTGIKSFKEIPGPKGSFLGTLPNYLPFIGKYSFEKMHKAYEDKYKLYGKLVREEIVPGVNLLYVYDPVDIEMMFRSEGKNPQRRSHLALQKYRLDNPSENTSGGLLPTNGEEWAKLRINFQQSLAKENVANFIPSTDRIVKEFANFIAKNNKKLEKEDFLKYLLANSAEVTGSNFFDTRFGTFDSVDNKNSLVNRVVHAAEEINSYFIKSDNGIGLWKYFETFPYKKFKKNMVFLENLAREHIQRGINGQFQNACILETWLEEGKNAKDIVTMSTDMIFAGIDTTAFGLSYLFYNLSRNERVQNELFKELKTLLPNQDTPITKEILEKLSYLKKVLKESHRFTPVALGLGRILQNDTIIGGYHVPKNTYLISQNQVACRSAEFIDKPDEFLPERWNPESRLKNRIHPFLSLSFGFGPRSCIGRRLAENTMLIVASRILRQFELEWKGCENLDCVTIPINKPDSPLHFQFKLRYS